MLNQVAGILGEVVTLIEERKQRSEKPVPVPGETFCCVFKDILQAQCNEAKLTSFHEWRDHTEKHLCSEIPEEHVVCPSCYEEFVSGIECNWDKAGDGGNFISEYLEHIFEHLFNGAVVEDIQCNSRTLGWLCDHQILSGERYRHLINTLPTSKYEEPPCSLPDYHTVDGEELGGEDHDGSSVTPLSLDTRQGAVRRRRRQCLSEKTADDELLAPLLSREPSPSSSAASSNVDWLHKFTEPSACSTLVESDSHTEQEQKDADDCSPGSGNKTSTSGSVSATSPNASAISHGASHIPDDGSSDTASPPPSAPPPSQSPPDPPHDSSGKPSTSRTRRVLDLLSCSKAIMFYIQSIQLCAISFQVACTTIYFNSTPPLRGTGKFSDSDYLSLLSTCLVQTIALALSLVGMRKKGHENLWIWTLTVASMSFLLSIASLVLYFVYTTFGDLFMCLAAVCQLWIWKFVIFGARQRNGAKSPTSDRSGCSETDRDLEMQQVRTR